MKRFKNISFATLALLFVFSQPLAAQRIEYNIDYDWHFHLGDLEQAESPDYPFDDWRKLDVPHDWSIEGEYSKSAPGQGSVAFLPTGIGWYKKSLGWDAAWSDKQVYIEFDGIFCNSSVWLNGHLVGKRPNGYLGLGYNLTPYLQPDGKNIITVRVDNSLQPAARWYTGSGIYRHVHLIVTDPIHIARNGTFVTTSDVSADRATIHIKAEIRNLRGGNPNVTVNSIVVDDSGKEIGRTEKKPIQLTDNTLFKEYNTAIEDSLTVLQPQLWGPDTPTTYQLITEIRQDGQLLDNYATRFGIRRAEFIPEKGMLLNGKPIKMKGVCIHQSTGAIGTAMTYDMWHRRLSQLKEMGCNAIRTSHYAYAPEFYAMCDTMGFMVMNELFDGWYKWQGAGKAKFDYGHYFLEWWERDLEEFIRRDRNHPSIMIWSLGNEVWGWDRHQYLQYLINKKFKDLDGTRPTTQAWALGTYIDIAGFNGNGELQGDLESFHDKQPQKLAVGTEIPHTRSTRGVYRTIGAYSAWIGPERIGENDRKKLFPVDSYTQQEVFPEFDKRYASSYDNQTRRISVREQWKQTLKNDFFIGEFRWTAFDYLGESWGWPARTNNYGIIDLAGFPKDNYFLYQSLWSEKPMVHLLPHWTWPGKEGIEIPVVVYTNGDEAELIVNGRSLGRKTMDLDSMQIVWKVPYHPGKITAIAFKQGKEIARKSFETAGKAKAVKLTPDRKIIQSLKREIVCITADIVDSRGRLVPAAANRIQFEVSGPYKLIGVENGDILDTECQKSLTRKAFMGKALLLLQATGESGTLRINAHAEDLSSDTVIVKIE